MFMLMFFFVLAPVPEGTAMEAILGLDDIIDL